MSIDKKYRFTNAQLKPLALDLGNCYASDMITVEAFKVGFLYRQKPESENDSGWRFLTGFETDHYINNPDNFAQFDVNWIANCDPEILPLLNNPVGSAFGRDPSKGNIFVEIIDEIDDSNTKNNENKNNT
ncbi:MAG: DUF2185 domain-containing protein [Planctomycetaceae bacterium]|jgi:hypothetical protein|nr:DUF2185 domain-containing protein [Planctomycetaceae bacterium]